MRNKYIGIIELKNSFYNFKPLGIVTGSNIELLDSSEKEELLPQSQKLNINISYNPRLNEAEIIQKELHDNQLMIMEFEFADLEDNYSAMNSRNATGYKIAYSKVKKEKMLRGISTEGFFYIIGIEKALGDFYSTRVVEIDPEDIPIGEKFFVTRSDRAYLGPYELKLREYDNIYYFQPEIRQKKYTVQKYLSSNIQRIKIYDMKDRWGDDIQEPSWTIAKIKSGATSTIEDVITDEQLLESFKDSLGKQSVKDGKIDLSDISALLQHFKDTVLSGSPLTKEIIESRFNRIKDILLSAKTEYSALGSIAKEIARLLVSQQEDKQVGELVNKLLEEMPDLLEHFQGSRIVLERKQKLEADVAELEAKVANLNAQIEQGQAALIEEEKQKAYAEISVEQRQTQDRYNELIKKLGVADDIAALERRSEKAREDVEYNERHVREIKKTVEQVEETLHDTMKRSYERMVNIAFDGFISNKLLQSASEWGSKNEEARYEKVEECLNQIKIPEMSREQVLDYICKTIQIERPQYSRNTIVNIMICISQGFLTVFSGRPGCGKTSICRIIGKTLGLSDLHQYADDSDVSRIIDRFLPISVERGWTSKRDLIGYYNPLTKTFDKSNGQIFEALKLMDIENSTNGNRFPYIVLLDEANLSQMEYYWADFMNVCDDLQSTSNVNLGENYIFSIPETLHFVATMNSDHTTDTLSPRLIDRAWIITLPRISTIAANQSIEDDMVNIIPWEYLKSVFVVGNGSDEALPEEITKQYNAIIALLKKNKVSVSPRSDLAIKRYLHVATRLMTEDEFGIDGSVVALDYAVSQRIIPHLNGYGEEYEIWLRDLYSYFANNGLTSSARLINDMIDRGNGQMKYYRFFE